jgi:hypothetical protein
LKISNWRIKNQGLIKIGCVSKPEVALAIQGMKDLSNARDLSLLYIAEFIPRYEGHMPFAHTSVKNRYPIFLMPIPSKKAFPNEIVVEQQLCR